METVTVRVSRADVCGEVEKATDYTGSKIVGQDGRPVAGARDRVLAGDADLSDLGRFWDESAESVNGALREVLSRVVPDASGDYVAELEVSVSWDRNLLGSVCGTLRSFFVASVLGKWFAFADKTEAAGYLSAAAGFLTDAERLLYSRRRPSVPED